MSYLAYFIYKAALFTLFGAFVVGKAAANAIILEEPGLAAFTMIGWVLILFSIGGDPSPLESRVTQFASRKKKKPGFSMLVSFERIQTHFRHGVIIDENSLVRIKGKSHGECRNKAFELFDTSFSICYDESKPVPMDRFPRGVVYEIECQL